MRQHKKGTRAGPSKGPFISRGLEFSGPRPNGYRLRGLATTLPPLPVQGDAAAAAGPRGRLRRRRRRFLVSDQQTAEGQSGRAASSFWRFSGARSTRATLSPDLAASNKTIRGSSDTLQLPLLKADWETDIDSNTHLTKCYGNREVRRQKSRVQPGQQAAVTAIVQPCQGQIAPSQAPATSIVHPTKGSVHVAPDNQAVSNSGTPHAAADHQGVSNSGRNLPKRNSTPVSNSGRNPPKRNSNSQPVWKEKVKQVQPATCVPSMSRRASMSKQQGQLVQGQPSRKGKAPLTAYAKLPNVHPSQQQASSSKQQQASSSLQQQASSSKSSKKKKYNLPGTKAPEEVMKYYRNSGRHGADESVKNQQVQYGVKALNIMLLYHFQKLLCSALKGIHRKNYLSRMESLPRILR